MSSDSVWYHDQQLAGSSSKAIPLSPPASNHYFRTDPSGHSPSHLQLGHSSYMSYIFQQKPDSDIHPLYEHAIRPHFHHDFLGSDDETTGKMFQYNDPPNCPILYRRHQVSSCLLNSSSSSNVEDLDADISKGQTPYLEFDDNELNVLVRHNPGGPSITWSTLYHPSASSQSCPSLSSPGADESPKPSQIVTPKLEDADDVHANFAPLPLSLSPYAPLPLPPIFHLESRSKMEHILINTPSSPRLPLWHFEEDKGIPLDPVLTPFPHPKPALAPLPGDISFARGSIASGCLWPPSLSLNSSSPAERNLCPHGAQSIPLEVALSRAQDFRLASPNTQLSLPFLLAFMGQFDGQPPWSCYIRGCGKQLTRKSHMVDHIRMHLNERVYTCDHCPQMFLRKADCKRHAGAHNPHKAFRCDSCIKSFGRKDLLTRHRRKCQGIDKVEGENSGIIKASSRNLKRKGTQINTILNTQVDPNAALLTISPHMLSMLPDDFKGKDSLELPSDGSNKENIPPFFLPGGHAFGNGVDPELEGRRRKKARTRV